MDKSSRDTERPRSRTRGRDDASSPLPAGRVGDLTRAHRLSVPLERLRAVRLDRQATFVLAQIDGRTTFEELADICGLSRADALRVFYDLLDRGIIR